MVVVVLGCYSQRRIVGGFKCYSERVGYWGWCCGALTPSQRGHAGIQRGASTIKRPATERGAVPSREGDWAGGGGSWDAAVETMLCLGAHGGASAVSGSPPARNLLMV
eukprot:111652-Chlamydomonas_euryale.AAC.1